MLVAVPTGCGDGARSETANPQRGELYSVSAPVVAIAGQHPKACAGIPLSLPPADCGGIELAGIDVHRVGGIIVYPNGTVQTPVLHLIGTWDGRRLSLTSHPEVVAPNAMTPLAVCTGASQEASPALIELEKNIAADRDLLLGKGILVLKTAPCGDHVLVVVPVADARTVAYLGERYVNVNVVSWLEPTGRQN
jgi:hypothetical protein